jgi:hypothetical protein
LFYAFYWGWNGGGSWGPRLLVPALPALIVVLAELGRIRIPGRWLAVLGAIVVASISVQVVGASVDYNRASVYTSLGRYPRIVSLLSSRGSTFERRSQSPQVQRIVDRNMFDWQYFPVVNEGHQLLRSENVVAAAFTPRLRIGRLGVAIVLILGGCALCVAPLRTERASRGDMPAAN